jgi:ankyrin repeat protein
VTPAGFTPLFFALKSGMPEMPVAVLAAGGNPDHIGPEGTTAVQMAIFQKDYAFAAHLIERGADVKAFDRNGQTLLQAAVIQNQPALVRMLLAKGADPNAWSGVSKVQWRYEPNFKTGEYLAPSRPPLIVAAEKGSTDVIQLLVEAGADPAVRLPDGTTILHAAVGSDRVAAVSAALKVLPDPNVLDGEGQTPLHRLLLTRHYPGAETVEILRLLSSLHARADIRDAKGRLPADLLEGETAELKAAYFAVFGNRSAAR